MLGDGDDAPSFFDELPAELLERIVTYLSGQPKHKHAKSFVHAQDVLTLLNHSEAMRSAARSYFTELVARAPSLRKRTLSVSLLVEERFSLPPASMDHAKFYSGPLNIECPRLLISLLEALGPAVRKLDVSESKAVLHEKALHSVVQAHATKIVHLVVDQRMLNTEFLTRFRNLRHLTARLRGYALHADSPLSQSCNLESVELIDLNPRSQLAQLWPHLTNLKQLTLTFDNPNLQATDDVVCQPYENIVRYCIKLSTLRLGNIYEWLHSYVPELCEGLREPLRHLSLAYGALHAETVAAQLAHIRHLCPDVLVDLECSSTHFVPALHALGSRARAIRSRSMFHYMPKYLREAAECSTGLRCLELVLRDPWACNFLKALLEEVGNGLTELHVCIYPNYYNAHSVVDNNSAALNVVAACTGSLRILNLQHVRPNASLGQLATANPHLRNVHLEIDNETRRALAGVESSFLHTRTGACPSDQRRWCAKEWIASTTAQFLQHCPHIRHLAIEEQGKKFASPVIPRKRITQLDDVCAAFRQRVVCIRVGEFYYEP